MHQLLYVITCVVFYFISIVQLMMLARALFSFVMFDETNALMNFVFAMTEPIITPVRIILERFDFINEMPIDISFIVTFFLLTVVQNFLPIIA